MLRVLTLFLVLLLPAVALAGVDQAGWEALSAQEKADLKAWLEDGAVEFAKKHNIVFVQLFFWNKLKAGQRENLARISYKYCTSRAGGNTAQLTIIYDRNLNNRLATYSHANGYQANKRLKLPF